MKYNKGYWSIRDFFSGITNFAGDIRYNPNRQTQLMGTIQPMADLVKDIRTTNKPYKSFSYFMNDFLQPARGFVLVFGGLFYVAASVVIGVGTAVGRKFGLTTKKPTSDHLLSWAGVGALSIVSGLLNIVATPLGWGKIINRLYLTARDSSPPVHFEQKQSVSLLVNQAHESKSVKTMADICNELHRKLLSYQSKGGLTRIDTRTESDRHIPLQATAPRQVPTLQQCTSYLALFQRRRVNNPTNSIELREHTHERSSLLNNSLSDFRELHRPHYLNSPGN